jgi:putative inorganic carbon (hco3(-)) transporter
MLFLIAIVFLALAVMAVTIWGPEVGIWAFVFALYANVPGIATQVYGVSQAFAACFAFILVPTLFYSLSIRNERVVIDLTFVLMLVFLAVMLMSSLVAVDSQIALGGILEYGFEGLLIYFFTINVIRDLGVLKRVIWALLLTGSLLASLTVYQDLTGNYDTSFGGLSQRHTEYWETKQTNETKQQGLRSRTTWERADRADGPTGDPNRYAQIMLVLVPLAVFMFWREKSSWARKILAGLGAVLISWTVLLTYSRGAFLAVVLLIGVLVSMRYIRIRQVAIGLAAAALLAAVVAPGYYERVQTIFNVENLASGPVSSEQEEVDAPTRGRLTEMLAALHVFMDHPILGVGPDQYIPFYSQEAMLNPEIAFRDIDTTRAAHTLYLQLAAEMGVFGIAVYIIIFINVLYRLLLERRRWIATQPELSHLITALFCSIVAYLLTGFFLHFNYQRYYWFMLALAGATIQILKVEHKKETIRVANLQTQPAYARENLEGQS